MAVTQSGTEESATSRPSFAPGSGTPNLLLDLINNTADPGYAAAAARRGSGPRSRYESPLAALGAVLVGLILVIAYLHAHRAAPQTAKLHSELVARVRAAQAMNDGLQRDITADEARLTALRDQILPAASQLRATLQRDQLASGSLAAYGPGLQVQLTLSVPASASQAPRAGVTSVADGSVLTDKDVRSVVNELWHDGAEAISVNNVRLTPISAIRFAGQAVLVDFQPITSPYVIRGIGDANVLETSFADSSVASRYHTLAAVGDISFSWNQESHLSLPAGSVAKPSYARSVTAAVSGSGTSPGASVPVPGAAASTASGSSGSARSSGSAGSSGSSGSSGSAPPSGSTGTTATGDSVGSSAAAASTTGPR